MRYFLNIILSFIFSVGFSQTTEFKKTLSIAKRYYSYKNYTNAEHHMLKCYRMDSSNTELIKLLNQLSIKQKKWKRVSVFSQKLQKKIPSESIKYYQIEILSYFYLQDYDKAEKILTLCLKQHKLNTLETKKCKKITNNIAFAQKATKNPVPYSPENLGKEINSTYAEYLPNLTQDGKYLIFTRMISRSMAFPSLQEDFYISKQENGKWLKSKPLSQTINTEQNEGAPSISADGSILYFTACNRSDCEGDCDIYYSYNRGNYWTTPKNLKAVNTKSWESQPNISADGKTLFFVSNRPGGKGNKDLWAVDILPNKTWGKPYNLGANINTEYNEISPFIHFDNQTLYFASDGWPGMGGKDIFVSRKSINNSWSVAKNLGYPINSQATDNSFFVDASGITAYFSSKRKGGYGKEDIYKFKLYTKARPQKTAYYKAIIFDAKTKQLLNAKYDIKKLNDSLPINLKKTINGTITVGLEANQKYIISVFSDGYLYFSSYIDSMIKDSLKLVEQKIYLRPIAKTKQFKLNNIEFDFDKATLKPSSTKELNLFTEYLNLNPRMVILIEGHTDNKGSDKYNLNLSQQRSNAVKKYLISKGIQKERIQTKGFGSKQVISEDKQERNRRVVVRIINN